MSPEQEIDALISAGWYVVESDFSEAAFERWREEVLNFLILLCGPDHPYTEFFRKKMLEKRPLNAHAGLGVLTAVRLGVFSAEQR